METIWLQIQKIATHGVLVIENIQKHCTARTMLNIQNFGLPPSNIFRRKRIKRRKKKFRKNWQPHSKPMKKSKQKLKILRNIIQEKTQIKSLRIHNNASLLKRTEKHPPILKQCFSLKMLQYLKIFFHLNPQHNRR